MTTSTRSRLIATCFAIGVMGAATVATPLLFEARLPGEVAIHWDRHNKMDGTTPRSLLGLVFVAPSVGVAVLVGAILWRRHGRQSWPAVLPILGVTTSTMLMAVAAVTRLNLDARLPAAARSPSGTLTIATVIVGLAVGAGMWRFLRPVLASIAFNLPRGDTPPGIGLRHTERTSWIGTARNLRMIVVTTAIALLSIGLAGASSAPTSWPLVLLVVILLGAITSLSEVRVTVNDRQVAIAFGPLRWPQRHIARSAIDHAEVVEVRPRQWGGWGWRGLPGRSAVIVRSGEAIRFRFHDGRALTVTVDDARRGAALINSTPASTH